MTNTVNGQPAPARRWTQRRAELIVVGVLVLVTVGVGASAVALPDRIGYWQDDGIYLATAKSLADGHGYRHPQLPGEPYQTKYPVLYPLLISLLWRSFPDLHVSPLPIQIVNTLLWAAGSWLAYRLMRRIWELPRWLVICGVILAFGRPLTQRLVFLPMSEPLYFFLSMAALSLLSYERPIEKTDSPVWGTPLRAASAGLLAAAAYLTRSIGVVLLAVVIMHFGMRRRWAQLAASAVVILAVAGSWNIWRARAREVNATDPRNGALAYDLDYGAWVPQDLGELAWVTYHSASELAFEVYRSITQTPPEWMSSTVKQGGPRAFLLYFGVLVVSALTFIGFVSVWKRSRPELHFYLLAYVAMVLVWPFPPLRLMAPINPILTTLILIGFYASVLRACSWAERKRARRSAAGLSKGGPVRARDSVAAFEHTLSPLVSYLSRGLVLLAVLICGFRGVRPLITQPVRESWIKDQETRESFIEILKAETAPDSVICSFDGAYLHLRTGRKFVPFMPYVNPAPLLYPDDRRFLQGGLVPTPGQQGAIKRMVQEGLIEYLRATHSDFVVPMSRDTPNGAGFVAVYNARREYFPAVLKCGGYYLVIVNLAP